ncbi:hypothetical protein JP75_24370 [Devosia riboflavina]|uniref:Uncharacterized protein n=2 Tax=Devosia riboflavina TaxID=46914 RepID=A0A087LUV3_9HYPH|nr:hypothetical protein JP75_24370 [Devosia riboflavina]
MRNSAGAQNFLRMFLLLVVVATGLGATATFALTPLPRPVASAAVEAGKSAPFVGAWSVSMPTMEVGTPDTDYAICALPVRIEAANETHIFYLGPREKEADAAMALIPDQDGARWEPIAGGPVFFAIWINTDTFYLYDIVPETNADWGMPFIYRRCP